MAEILQTIGYFLTFEIVQRAFICGILIALCASLLGVNLVLRRLSFIGEGLSHMAFLAMGVAGAVGLTNNLIISLPVTVIAAIILLKSGGKAKINGDAVVAILAVSSLALGYVLMNQFPSESGNVSADVCGTLFGSASILNISSFEMWTCIILSVLTVLFYVFFYNKIFGITFDENFSRATGVKTNLYNYLIATVTAITIVLAMTLVGSLLISALIIFPALSAMRAFKTFKSVTICSAIISVINAAMGILISIVIESPVGPTIVVADLGTFIIFFFVGFIKSLTTRKVVLAK